jgi:hypothetical protein
MSTTESPLVDSYLRRLRAALAGLPSPGTLTAVATVTRS